MLRVLAESFVLSPASGVTIRTRLRPTPAEEQVLREVGTSLGSLYRADLVRRRGEGKLDVRGRARSARASSSLDSAATPRSAWVRPTWPATGEPARARTWQTCSARSQPGSPGWSPSRCSGCGRSWTNESRPAGEHPAGVTRERARALRPVQRPVRSLPGSDDELLCGLVRREQVRRHRNQAR